MTNAIEPDYYQKGTIDVIEAFRLTATKEQFRGGMKLNVMKYIMRYENKNGIEDLEKAREYIDRLIKAEERYEADDKTTVFEEPEFANADEPSKNINAMNIYSDPEFPNDTIYCEENERFVLITTYIDRYGNDQINLIPLDAIRFAGDLTAAAKKIFEKGQ